MSEFIRIDTQDRVQTITIARPEKKNAITQDMYKAMADAIDAYGANDDIRALVLTGEGDYFTSGNDVKDFAVRGMPKPGADPSELPGVMHFLRAVSTCPKPLIAAVNGPGIGIGLTVLLHCDLVYAAKGATLSAPFVRLALVPEAASSLLLSQSVGMAVANDILLAGRTLSADEALSFGLVARVFDDNELMEEVSKIAAHVAASSPTSLKRSKELIRYQQDVVAQRIMHEGKIFAEQLQTEDFKESAMALMQKRRPVYK